MMSVAVLGGSNRLIWGLERVAVGAPSMSVTVLGGNNRLIWGLKRVAVGAPNPLPDDDEVEDVLEDKEVVEKVALLE